MAQKTPFRFDMSQRNTHAGPAGDVRTTNMQNNHTVTTREGGEAEGILGRKRIKRRKN